MCQRRVAGILHSAVRRTVGSLVRELEVSSVDLVGADVVNVLQRLWQEGVRGANAAVHVITSDTSAEATELVVEHFLVVGILRLPSR